MTLLADLRLIAITAPLHAAIAERHQTIVILLQQVRELQKQVKALRTESRAEE